MKLCKDISSNIIHILDPQDTIKWAHQLVNPLDIIIHSVV